MKILSNSHTNPVKHITTQTSILSILSILPVVIIILFFRTTAYTQSVSEDIDKLFTWSSANTPGCVCAVAQQGKLVHHRAYGSADLERDVMLHLNSKFDIGSLVKQFVAAATLIMVEKGELSLDEDIRKYIPELPDYGNKITLNHLLTHTSGLRDWTGLVMLNEQDKDALTLILKQHSLNFQPGEEWSYSNSGYVLLKEIIARKSGMSFSKFVQTHLFGPLGMKSTVYQHDLKETLLDRALAYSKKNEIWKQDILIDNDRGGGGALFSTAEDLIIWNEALSKNLLGKFVSDKLLEKAVLNNGRQLNYSRGLFLDMHLGMPEIWHGGSAAGYKGWLGRFPSYGLSISLLCNAGDQSNVSDIAEQIYSLFVPESDKAKHTSSEPSAIVSGSNVTVQDLKSRTGLFINNQSAASIRLIMEEGWLRIAGGPRLVAESSEKFVRWNPSLMYMSQDSFTIKFISEDIFELISMEGFSSIFSKVKPVSINATEYDSYAGQYTFEDLDAVMQIKAAKDGLIVQLRKSMKDGIEFKAVSRDLFQYARMSIKFHRNEDGSIQGFDYSNPVLKNLRYVKSKDL